MNTNTVNISFQKSLLSKIDDIAREESRSRSELIREAARMYIERKKRWKQIFALAGRQAKILKLKKRDVENAIKGYRKSRVT